MRKLSTLSSLSKAILLLCLLFTAHLRAATITADTLHAWEGHVRHSKAQLLNESANQSRFVPVLQQNTAPFVISGKMMAVPSGLVHHWAGSMFISNAHVADVLRILQDYDAYSRLYKPAIAHSQLLDHQANSFRYRLKFVQKGFGIKAGLLGDFETTYFSLSKETGYSITESTRLTELQNTDTPDETPLSLSEAHGYVERVLTIVRYQESAQGVAITVESLTLSRGVPASIRWLISSTIDRFSRQTMNETLGRLKDKIEAVRTVESASNR